MIRRAGILGDLHGEHERLGRAVEWMHGQRLDALLCTGDIADGRGCINECCELLINAEVMTVAGNHDRWLLTDRVRHLNDAHLRTELSDANHAFLAALPVQRELDTVAGRVLLCHGVADNDLAKVWPGTVRSAVRRSVELDELLSTDRYRFLFNGHMHYRVLIDFPQLLLMNAGTLKGDAAGISIVDFAAGSVSSYELGDVGFPRLVCERETDAAERRVWQNTGEFDGSWEAVTLYSST